MPKSNRRPLILTMAVNKCAHQQQDSEFIENNDDGDISKNDDSDIVKDLLAHCRLLYNRPTKVNDLYRRATSSVCACQAYLCVT